MQVLDNFESSYSKFLDARQSWDSLEALQANTDILMPNGFKVFCKEEAKWYILTATDEADPSTYTWSEDGGTDEEAISLASTAITMVSEVDEKAEEALATAATAIAAIDNIGSDETKLDKVSEIPAEPSVYDTVLYIGETTENYIKGHIYQYQENKHSVTLNLTIGSSYYKADLSRVPESYPHSMYSGWVLNSCSSNEELRNVFNKGILSFTSTDENLTASTIENGPDEYEIHFTDSKYEERDASITIISEIFTGWVDISINDSDETKLDKVSEIPAEPSDDDTVLYIGETTENYTKGHIYQYSNGEWNDLTGSDKSKLEKVSEMPDDVSFGDTVLYIGETNENYTKGHIYSKDTHSWKDITPTIVSKIIPPSNSSELLIYNGDGYKYTEYDVNDDDNPKSLNLYQLKDENYFITPDTSVQYELYGWYNGSQSAFTKNRYPSSDETLYNYDGTVSTEYNFVRYDSENDNLYIRGTYDEFSLSYASFQNVRRKYYERNDKVYIPGHIYRITKLKGYKNYDLNKTYYIASNEAAVGDLLYDENGVFTGKTIEQVNENKITVAEIVYDLDISLNTYVDTQEQSFVFDDVPTENSKNFINSGAVYNSITEVNEKAEEALATAATAIATANNSSASLTENITPNVEVGGIGVGDTLTTGQQMTDILKKLLVKYFEPVITLSADKALINKKGATIEAPITITVTAEKKSDDVIFYSINYDGNDVSTGNNPDGGEITYIHQTDISTDTMFIGSISDGKSTVNKTIKFEFINPYYYGSVNDNEISDFTGLTEETVKKNINKKVSYTSSAEYLVFAYDATYGDLTSIKDKNNFENLPAFTKTVMEVNGENYNVYISSDKITCSNFEYTFKI